MSQLIAKKSLVLAFEDPKPTDSELDLLEQSLHGWQTNFRSLRDGTITGSDRRPNSEAVGRLFKKAEVPFQQMSAAVESGLASSRSTAEEIQKQKKWVEAADLILSAEPEFLRWMDEIVFQYDAEATARVTRLSKIEWILLCLTMLVLTAEALWIFRPALRRLQSGLESLDEHNIS